MRRGRQDAGVAADGEVFWVLEEALAGGILAEAVGEARHDIEPAPVDGERCFRHQLLLPRPYLVLTKPLRLDIQCQRAASVKIGWKYLDD